MKWDIVLSNQAQKDSKKIQRAGLRSRVEKLFGILSENPFKTPPNYEKLVGNLAGFYSRRINIQHRLVYVVYTQKKVVHILRMWTHYE